MKNKSTTTLILTPLLPLLLGGLLLILFSAASVARAAPNATLDVTNTNDSGAGSLRQAIADANPGDTIQFDAALSSQTITLTNELVISKSVTIQGNVPITVSGNNATRVFNVLTSTLAPTVTVTFDSLSIISGSVQTTDCGVSGPYKCGGGIILQNSGVAVTVTNSTLSGNSAEFGGAIDNEGGVLLVRNSTLTGNEAIDPDGSLALDDLNPEGGGIYNEGGTVMVENSTLSHNTADWGGGIYGLDGFMILDSSTLNGNTAVNGYGGGVTSFTESGDCNAPAAFIIRNSTLSGNSAGSGGGGAYNGNGVMEVTSSTLAENAALFGGGLLSYNDDITCTRIGNSIVADNTADDVDAFETGQRFVSLGYNLIGVAGKSVDFTQEFTATGDMTNTNPLLGPLADNGGPTFTHMPLPGSPAVDAGSCSSGLTIDQRGVARPQGVACDIGAVEFVFNLFYLPLVMKMP